MQAPLYRVPHLAPKGAGSLHCIIASEAPRPGKEGWPERLGWGDPPHGDVPPGDQMPATWVNYPSSRGFAPGVGWPPDR
jgi:hypothetical protein